MHVERRVCLEGGAFVGRCSAIQNLFTNLQAPGPSRPGPNLTAQRPNSKSGPGAAWGVGKGAPGVIRASLGDQMRGSISDSNWRPLAHWQDRAREST